MRSLLTIFGLLGVMAGIGMVLASLTGERPGWFSAGWSCVGAGVLWLGLAKAIELLEEIRDAVKKMDEPTGPTTN